MTEQPTAPSTYPPITRTDVFMIGTRRLWLRWPRASDAACIAAISGHPEVSRRVASCPEGADPAFAAEQIGRAHV